MDNNYSSDHNYSGGTESEPQYGNRHSFTGSTTEQYDAQAAGGYSNPQQSAPNYGGQPMNGGYSNPQQGAPNYGGQPMNGGYGYPNGQPYPAPNYYGGFKDPYEQPVPDESGGRGIAALVVGILSWLDWCIPVLGLCTSLIGLILGIQGRKGGKKGFAIAGIVLSSISGLFGVFFNIGFVVRIIQEASGV
ncbi:DUF4190 domain-containing protein [Ruminococcus sp.]|uniref:DUF4190 domain-containing protein n=1 Tax=Ruminococcus sp. TaxID=41978 RepID=UPI0025E324BA|nr:DUF4190 domain-containing protein [Ruminococcus sp.]MBQ6253012.1 DUF4190 domain-containing protein [Ruminococcus sp.]